MPCPHIPFSSISPETIKENKDIDDGISPSQNTVGLVFGPYYDISKETIGSFIHRLGFQNKKKAISELLLLMFIIMTG